MGDAMVSGARAPSVLSMTSDPPPSGARANIPRVDLDLVDRANRGDQSALSQLYERHRDYVARLALRFTGDREDAMDVLQETFIYFFGRFPGFELRAKLTTFLYPVVRNCALSHRRKKARANPVDPQSLDIAAHAPNETGWELETLHAVVRLLPEPQREVVLMRFVDDFSMAEIAEALEIPLGTVKSRLHHALNALREDENTKRYFDR